MLFLIVLAFAGQIHAQSDVEDAYRNDGFERVGGGNDDVTVSAPAPEPPPQTSAPKTSLRPPVLSRPASPSSPIVPREPGQFTKITTSDRNSPIFPKFQEVFELCRKGCDAGWAHCYRSGSSRSCHSTGDAMDLHGLVCGGIKYSAYTQRFAEFVACVRNHSYQGKRWKVLFRQTTGSCAGSNRDQTKCHFDHGHFTLGCWRNGKFKW